jgi:hypothetical protein
MAPNFSTIRVEDWLQGPLHVFDSQAARANKRVLDAHLQAEWTSDIDATMRTIHPDNPWQIVHGLGVEVRGFEEVRAFYAARFEQWTGPGMEHFSRVTIGDTCGYLECVAGRVPGQAAPADGLDVPAILVVDFRDQLLLGETVYLDSALAREQLSQQARTPSTGESGLRKGHQPSSASPVRRPPSHPSIPGS